MRKAVITIKVKTFQTGVPQDSAISMALLGRMATDGC